MVCWSIKAPWSYETGSSIDVTSVNFNSKIVHEDDIFGRQDILHFLPRRIQFISNNMQDPETPDGQFKHFVVQNASDLINQFVYMMKLHIPDRVVSKKLNLFCTLADNSGWTWNAKKALSIILEILNLHADPKMVISISHIWIYLVLFYAVFRQYIRKTE